MSTTYIPVMLWLRKAYMLMTKQDLYYAQSLTL